VGVSTLAQQRGSRLPCTGRLARALRQSGHPRFRHCHRAGCHWAG